MNSIDRFVLGIILGLVIIIWWRTLEAAGVSNTLLIEDINLRPEQHILLKAEGGVTWGNPDNCDRHGRLIIPATDDELYKRLHTMALSAHLSAHPVKAYVEGCVLYNGKTYPKVVGLRVF